MGTSDALLVGAIIVLALIALYFAYAAYGPKGTPAGGGAAEGFGGPDEADERAYLHWRNDAQRGWDFYAYSGKGSPFDTTKGFADYLASDATYSPLELGTAIAVKRGKEMYPQQPPSGIDRFHLTGRDLSHEETLQAEQQAWAPSHGRTMADMASGQEVEPVVSADSYAANDGYLDYISDLVTDKRTRENHKLFVEEMTPWSRCSAVNVDKFNPGDFITFQGLQRPQGVAQLNPLLVTDMDADDLANNGQLVYNRKN